MEKVWLKSYPEGIPAEINPDAYPSLQEVVKEACEKFADKIAYENFEVGISYRQLWQLVNDFAAYCQQVLGMKKGDRLALMMPNCLQYPVCLFGGIQAGLTIVNVNPLYTPRELKHQLIDSGCETIVLFNVCAHVLEPILKETPIKNIILTSLGDLMPNPKGAILNFVCKYVMRLVPKYHLEDYVPLKKALQQGKSKQLEPTPLKGDDIAFLQYTGGTTGAAKGTMLTQRNIIANLEQASAWIKPYINEGEVTLITPLPLYHIFSLTANCLTFMKQGAKNILITNPRDIPKFIATIKNTKFNVMTGVNTLFNALLQHPKFKEVDFSGISVVLSGGMSLKKDVADRWYALTGKPLVEAYGLTETSPAVTINPLDIKEFNGCIGIPVPSTEVSIRDDDGNELGYDEAGELCVRGPQVMEGYYNHPDNTAAAFFPDGWLRTGDICSINQEGFVKVLDRKKDMVIVSGFNVYPNEVEDVLVTHEEILDAAVIGIESEETGEAVKAYIVRKNPELSKEDIIEYARTQLTSYKVPKIIEFRDELPKTPVGKILRRALRE